MSPSAVSRVFTEGGSASAKTREKVMAAAEGLGYRPSMLARGLVGNRTNLITLVTGSMADPFDALFLDRFAQVLATRGIRLLLTSAKSDRPGDSGLLQALDYQSDAVVIAAGTLSREHSELCVKSGMPVILAGRVLEAPGVDSVLADNVGGGRKAAELLIRTGCRRLAYMGRGLSTFSDRERHEGFAAAAGEAGLTVMEQRSSRDDDVAFRAATDLLSGPFRPDGIFCSADGIAVHTIEAARALGLSVPEEVSVVGFNNIPTASWRSYRLTTLDYPVESVVADIVSLLERRLRDPGRANEVRRIPTPLVPRATTREIPS
ncbi:MAG: LacI family DNA-binding transcriptional regulator [Rhodospirillales bacterium]|nr:LacI family DNA-binding transcriptional regulator [Rhodospirillales bacterium]